MIALSSSLHSFVLLLPRLRFAGLGLVVHDAHALLSREQRSRVLEKSVELARKKKSKERKKKRKKKTKRMNGTFHDDHALLSREQPDRVLEKSVELARKTKGNRKVKNENETVMMIMFCFLAGSALVF